MQARKEERKASRDYLRRLHGGGNDVVIFGLFGMCGKIGVEPLQYIL